MAVDDNTSYLSVRETARRLGVHENTVRNWAREGILPTARIPGSRFHRFDERDVERLRKQRGATVASVEEERRTIGPELVNGSQLSHWATTRAAHDKFPELVRRLLASSPGITKVSVRSGDGVYISGWDGRAESVGTAYLPAGSLCFEMGVGGNPRKKADEDYEKRRDDPDGVQAAESIFIFITPRRWPGAESWANKRRAEAIFADVRTLDADSLEGWLQDTPAVHQWISEELGRRPRDAESLERWWARFQSKTDPPLPASLFLAGRDEEQQQLIDFLGGPPGVISVQSDWRDEALAFICATIEAMTREVDNPVQPPLIVLSPEVWDRIVMQPGRMTLLPLFEGPDFASAQDRGHHVLVPIGRDHVARGQSIKLRPPGRQAATDALEAVGVTSRDAYQLGALARRSMPSLVRRLARDPLLSRPPWARPPSATTLAPLVLVGAWTSNDVDTTVVSRMAGRPWSEIERTLQLLLTTEDPPFVRAANRWHLASPEEAYLLVRDSLTAGDLQLWHQITVEVLVETDPRLELSAEDRPMAGVMGITPNHSSALRRGLAEGVALAGSLDGTPLGDGASGEDHAREVVREIFGRANEDSTGSIWRSLADVLALLAEAAPDVFLDAVHDDLDREKPVLASMFQDKDQSSALYSSSPHTGLLWALETLCWSSEHLLEATHALARLQLVDPGGRLANRPLGSLGNVLVGWIRHTGASIDLKVQALDQICRHLPEVGWRILLTLWPSHHGVSSPPSAPRFRDWKPEDNGVSMAEWIEYIGHFVRLALGLVGTSAERWAELGENLGPLPPADRDRVLEALDSFVTSASLDSGQRLLLWERLRKEIAHHRRFPDADWSMGEETLARLQAVVDLLEPKSNVERFGYLFDWHPDLPDIDPLDHRAYDQKLLELRTEAVNNTLKNAAVDGLRKLATRSPVPSQLGWIAGAVCGESFAPQLVAWLDSENEKLREVAASWASRKLNDHGVGWLREVLALLGMESTVRREALVLCAPATREMWQALSDIDEDLASAYWEGMAPWRISPQDVDFAARKLLAHNRAWVAVDVLASDRHGKGDEPSSLTPKLVEEVLNAAMLSDPRGSSRMQSLGYEVGVLLDYLESQGSKPETLSRYEFFFFRLLDHQREPRALFATLNRDPQLFVDLVKRVYRGKNEPRRQLGEEEEALARHAWWVLHNWHGFPGRLDDGGVDVEHLQHWIRDARLAMAESDRADIGDEQIGQVLAGSPRGADGAWPAEEVRDILEAIGSPSIEAGMHIGVVNRRGVTSRGVFDGGNLERDLVVQYRQWATEVAGRWPRTSRLLRGLAENYEREARREDERAQIVADTEIVGSGVWS